MADIEQQALAALNALDVAIASAHGTRVSLHLTRARQLRAALASQGEQQIAPDAESAARAYEHYRDAGATHEQALHAALADALASQPQAPAAAETVAWKSTRDTVIGIMRSVCESEPSDPEHPDTVCISVLDLESIVAAEIGCLILQDDPQANVKDRLLAALERAAAAESALRALADECENDNVAGWEDRMQQKILAANTLLAAAPVPEVDRAADG